MAQTSSSLLRSQARRQFGFFAFSRPLSTHSPKASCPPREGTKCLIAMRKEISWPPSAYGERPTISSKSLGYKSDSSLLIILFFFFDLVSFSHHKLYCISLQIVGPPFFTCVRRSGGRHPPCKVSFEPTLFFEVDFSLSVRWRA